MADLDELENEIRELIIEALRLEDVAAEDIHPEEPLFNAGLGLDSIDALELGVAISKKYSISLSRNPAENSGHFRNVRSLAAMVRQFLSSSPSQGPA